MYTGSDALLSSLLELLSGFNCIEVSRTMSPVVTSQQPSSSVISSLSVISFCCDYSIRIRVCIDTIVKLVTLIYIYIYEI